MDAHDDSTVVPRTGADCSAPQHLPGANLPHSQHLSNQGGGEGKVTDSDSEGEGGVQQGENDYLLADPRLAEAHDSSTVVPCTGSTRSSPRHLTTDNLPYSQHLRAETRGNGVKQNQARAKGGKGSKSGKS